MATTDQTEPTTLPIRLRGSPYCYSPISLNSTRLLFLMPSEDKTAPVRCRMVEYPLQTQTSQGVHPYEALSYTWGSPANPQPIYVVGSDPGGDEDRWLLVTPNLHTALLHLRDCSLERVMWVDAVCINQNDNDEKGRQVQSMAKIYAMASCTVVWLGEAAADSDQALEYIRKASNWTDFGRPPTSDDIEPAVFALLERSWFQRIWILQEVAAARRILIKCGSPEIDGYVFYAGLDKLNLAYHTRPNNLQSLIPSITPLIRDAIFRQREGPSQPPGRFSLRIRPLGELVDLYHTRNATDPRDRVFALLGMSSDDFMSSTVELTADYAASWKFAFRKLLQFSLSQEIAVETWDEHNIAVIRGHYCLLGEICAADSRQGSGTANITINWEKTHLDPKGDLERQSYVTLQASAKRIHQGDVICLLQGASSPTIIRAYASCAVIITITFPLADDSWSTNAKWSHHIQSIKKFPKNSVFIWDWNNTAQPDLQDQKYESLMGSGLGEELHAASLDRAARLWSHGLLLDSIGRPENAASLLREAVEGYDRAHAHAAADGPAIGKQGLAFGAEARFGTFLRLLLDKGAALGVVVGHGKKTLWLAAAQAGRQPKAAVRLLMDKGGALKTTVGSEMALLWRASEPGYKAAVCLFFERAATIDAQGSLGMLLLWAAKAGHEPAVRRLLDLGASHSAKGTGQKTPLLLAAEAGHESVVRLLLDRGADIHTKDSDSRTPLSQASQAGHESIVKLLLAMGADVDAPDRWGRPALSAAALAGHGSIVRLLVEHGANFGNTDSNGQTPLDVAIEAERGANV